MPLRVLIVEDQANVADVIQVALETLMRPQFPLLEFMRADTLRHALELIRGEPPPDLVTLDLKLKDSGADNTLAHLKEIEAICPVVICTGKNIDGFEGMIRELNIDVIKKGKHWMDGSFIKACARALLRSKATEKMQERIVRLKEILAQMYPPSDTRINGT